jgi:hypothetical protein
MVAPLCQEWGGWPPPTAAAPLITAAVGIQCNCSPLLQHILYSTASTSRQERELMLVPITITDISTIGQTNQAHSTAGESHLSLVSILRHFFRRDVDLLFRGHLHRYSQPFSEVYLLHVQRCLLHSARSAVTANAVQYTPATVRIVCAMLARRWPASPFCHAVASGKLTVQYRAQYCDANG